MSILVTGGTGSLGYSILSNLSGTNHELYSFSDELPQPWQKVEGVQYLTGDLLDFRNVLEMIQKVSPTHIYHLASQSSVGLSYKKPYETLNINLLGTQTLLEAVRQVVPKAKVLLLSSSEIYGRTEQNRVVIVDRGQLRIGQRVMVRITESTSATLKGIQVITENH